MSVYDKIKSNYDYLSKTERRVAKYCLDNYLEISNYTLSQLSNQSKCGEATIFRFLKKIGISSFHDLKVELTEESQYVGKMVQDSFVSDVYQSIQTAIEYTIHHLDQNELNEMAHLIQKAGKIICAGVGNSGIPAEACAMRFLRNGKNGIYLKDYHFQLIYLNEMTTSDIAILFSITGETDDILCCAEILKKRKIKIISITSSIVSSLAKMSDYHILVKYSNGPINGGNMISQITQMYIADLITTSVGLLEPKQMMKAREITYDYATAKRKPKVN